MPLLHTISAAGEYGEKVHQFLGIFAVPVLLFISGFFSKDIEKARRKAVRSLLCPYLICQSIYLLVAALSLKFRLITSTPISTSILAPSGPFYYLLVLFILIAIIKKPNNNQTRRTNGSSPEEKHKRGLSGWHPGGGPNCGFSSSAGWLSSWTTFSQLD